jgi:diacylglycerol O-acyltransferase
MSQSVERMSRVDTAWLRMDNDVNLMMIVGVWLLQPGITHAALTQRIEDKLLKYGRFRQKVVQDAMGASWVEDEHFDIERHVVREPARAAAPGQSPRDALRERRRRSPRSRSTRRHPLWQFHLIEDFDGRSVLVSRVHHCIGDGIALISVMLSITDGGMAAAQAQRRRRRAGPHEGEHDWIPTLLKPLTDITIKAIG